MRYAWSEAAVAEVGIKTMALSEALRSSGEDASAASAAWCLVRWEAGQG